MTEIEELLTAKLKEITSQKKWYIRYDFNKSQAAALKHLLIHGPLGIRAKVEALSKLGYTVEIKKQ